jgi:DNA polymerase zeta
MTTLLRNKAVMGTSFRVFESHIPYNLQFFIDYKIYGMAYVNFREVKFRLPLPESKAKRHIGIDSNESHYQAQGALCHSYHLASNIPLTSVIYAKRDTKSELEVDVDVSQILEASQSRFTTPNTSGMALPEQMVPSLTYMWDDERKRRYERAKAKNFGVSPLNQSFGLGSAFDSSCERLVDAPHDFHQTVLERFRRLVAKDELDAKTLFTDTAPLSSQVMATPSAIARHPHLEATPLATTRYKELTSNVNHIFQQHLQSELREASQVPLASEVDEELASSQVSDESLLEALEWMRADDWNDIDWESRVGRESDVKFNGHIPTEEEEQWLIDKDIEAILASQREREVPGESDLQPQETDLSEPAARKKREHKDSSPSVDESLYEYMMTKPTKRVKFVETTTVLHFSEEKIRPDMIAQEDLKGVPSSPIESFPSIALTEADNNGMLLDELYTPTETLQRPPNNDMDISPLKEVPETPAPPDRSTLNSQADDFRVEDTPPSGSVSSGSTSADISPANVTSEIMDSKVLSVSSIANIASIANMASTASFLSSFSRAFAKKKNAPKPSVPVSVPALTASPSPSPVPLQSSGTAQDTSREFYETSPPSVSSISFNDEPSMILLPTKIEESNAQVSSHQESVPATHLVLKYFKPPPTWEEITAGMKRREMPLIKYQAPFYGVPSDRPARSSKFAGISIPVESTRFDTLPAFETSNPPNSSTAQYHLIGAERQKLKRTGIRGILRALTPARPPPLVSLLPAEAPTGAEASSSVQEPEDEEEYELVANSPKLAEQFRLVAGVRPVKNGSTTKFASNAHQILEEEGNRRRGAPSFSQTGKGDFAPSQIDRAAPSDPHGFALRPEARRPLGGRGIEGLTLFSLEVFSTSNGPLRPNPLVSPVEAIYYCIRDDFEIRSVGPEKYKDKLGVLCLARNTETSPKPSHSLFHSLEHREFDTELELLLAFRDLLVEADPDVVMGYECQQNSLGYIFERAIRLGIPKYIPSFGRASGDLGNQFENSADSWGYQHASGISMVGRIVFNVWRIMRSELALQSYSFESIAFHVLHQRIPHFDHVKLTSWYTGLSDLGLPHITKPAPIKHPWDRSRPRSSVSSFYQRAGDSDPMEGIEVASQVDQIQPDSDNPSVTVPRATLVQDTANDPGDKNPAAKPVSAASDALPKESDLSKRSWPSAPDRWRVDLYFLERAQCNLFLLDSLNIISRTSEFARMYGITFYSVLSRGSQYRVESLMLRMTKPQNYICVSPTRQQVAQQLAPESIPLVMEPLSAFYTDPVLVLDFQSLYPSVIIAYNLCFSTCLGRISGGSAENGEALNSIISKRMGVVNYDLPVGMVSSLKDDIYCSANGVMYVKPELRIGTMPRMLHEILETRVMIKESMKLLKKNDPLTWSLLDSRQLGLKMIANVTYGYASASFSGRMPCVDLADSIVQTGRETLERAIKLINTTKEWGAKVIYGDTDSVFVLLKGATKERAFRVGAEIAKRVTDDNPWPVKLKFEKVYHPCVLLAKKRYVGYMYESVDQEKPIFDAKGIETVRRDTCPVVSKVLEKSLRMLFESKDMSLIKSFLRNQWTKILTGRVSMMDFLFRKEVRLGTYRGHHAPPAALVAMKELERDPRATPRYGERVPYLVINGSPKSRLIDLVYHPHAIAPESGISINATYYITKNIIPVLSRVFDLFGVSIADWFAEMPKKLRTGKYSHLKLSEGDLKLQKQTIDHYYSSQYCPICDTLTASPVCENCMKNRATASFILSTRMRLKEQRRAQLLEICMQCTSNPARSEEIDCDSLDCTVYFQRMKYSEEARKILTFATLLQKWDSDMDY